MEETDPWLEPCFYCGMPGWTLDHVVPTSVVIDARSSGDEALIRAVEDRHRRMTVRACQQCNSIASNVLDPTLAVRKARVKARLRFKYRNLLDMPDWYPHELMDLSPQLRNRVLWKLMLRDEVRKRIAW